MRTCVPTSTWKLYGLDMQGSPSETQTQSTHNYIVLLTDSVVKRSAVPYLSGLVKNKDSRRDCLFLHVDK